MDVVYALGTGSTWNDNELRYSLRSLTKYVRDLDRVIVVGHQPPWLTNVTHVACKDRHLCKERNIMEKVRRACELPDLSRRFLHVHDDHFALGPSDPEVPYWRGGQLWHLAGRLASHSHYAQALRNTHEALLANKCSTYNFDLHLPIVYDKVLFPLAMQCYDWTVERGYVVKSLYANTVREPGLGAGDLKLTDRYTMTELVQKLRGRRWWSIGPSSLGTNLKNLLDALYPEKSPFEM